MSTTRIRSSNKLTISSDIYDDLYFINKNDCNKLIKNYLTNNYNTAPINCIEQMNLDAASIVK
eukprot:UN34367